MSAKLAWPVAAGAIAMAVGAWGSMALRPDAAAAPAGAAAPVEPSRDEVLVEIRDELRRIREGLELSRGADDGASRVPAGGSGSDEALDELVRRLDALLQRAAAGSRAGGTARDDALDLHAFAEVSPQRRAPLWEGEVDDAAEARFFARHRFKSLRDIVAEYGAPDTLWVQDGGVLYLEYERADGRSASFRLFEGIVVGAGLGAP